ncbi:MAG TPA: phosphate-starvation-inducible PsiE family protein [Desulfovibrio sp.]|uniref:phosphate-starvation-inducible PsiE family protein n=1 Tax=Desulfovibrio sp. TaxID=885 RepID=UPI002BF25AA2|nr:phosphate-starvation-inducible PsiE family protein [Desulfovibrio sp.]HMM39008.1 phosphate-starvation-inducible PsiE family protein [Desulfovibrio sp.]
MTRSRKFSLDALSAKIERIARKRGAYAVFEKAVAYALDLVISAIVVVALYRLVDDVASLLLRQAFDPLNHEMFQTVFGGIMTLLIAMEFKHSISTADRSLHNVIHVKTVLLVSILALARKFIVLEVNSMDAAKIAALSLGLVSLGGVYWLMRERDSWDAEREKEEKPWRSLLGGRVRKDGSGSAGTA